MNLKKLELSQIKRPIALKEGVFYRNKNDKIRGDIGFSGAILTLALFWQIVHDLVGEAGPLCAVKEEISMAAEDTGHK